MRDAAAPNGGEAYLRTLEWPVREFASAIRGLVLKSAPELKERIKHSSRHYDVKVRSIDEARNPALRSLIREAVRRRTPGAPRSRGP